MFRNVASIEQRSISIFVAYAPQDTLLQQELEKHLSPLKQDGFISLWSVDKIIAGNKAAAEIEQHLNTAQIILHLISADFFADEQCCQMMTRSLQIDREQVRIIPIILRPVDWGTSLISTVKVLPTNRKPVTRWSNRDAAFSHIAEEVRKVVLEMLNSTTDNRILTESDLRYLHWLIELTSSLDTRGIYLPQRPFQMKLEEIYIALNASSYEDVFQEQGPSRSPDALTAETSEQTHTPTLISDVVSHHDHLMILGEPGSGKTTFLRYLALKHAQALCEHRDTEFGKAHFPILLRIADYVEYGMHQGKSLSEYLAIDCTRHECPTPDLADVLKAHLQTGTCLVLIDGLDEVHTNDRRAVVQHLEEFVHRYENLPNRFIITSRHAGYREAPLDDTFALYILQELDEMHIWHFLEFWCPAVEAALSSQTTRIIQMSQVKYEVEGLKRAIQTVPGIRRLATNPLYLRILAQLHRAGVPLPQHRVALYDRITNTLTQTWRTTQPSRPTSVSSGSSSLFDQPSLVHLLSKLAYWLHLKKPGGFASEHEICRELGKEWTRLMNQHWSEKDPRVERDVKQFLRAMRDHTGILTEDTPHQYRFVHLIFEEYYAAHYLVANSLKRAQCIHTHFHDPRWQEPILLTLGLIGIESPDEACILVETAILAEGEEARANMLVPSAFEPLLGRDYFFALRCMGDDIPVHATRAEQLIERLLREITQQTGSGRFQRYQEALTEGLKYVEMSAYASIMLPHLIKNRESPDLGIRIWSLYSLGRIGRFSESEKIRPHFLDTLRDENPQIRSAALWGLSTMLGSEITATFLHILSNDTDTSVRKYAVKYLGERRVSSPQITKALLDILYSTAMPDILLRDAAIESLGQLDDASAPVISALIALLGRDILLLSDESILKSLQQLSQLSSEVVPMIVDVLQGAAPRVRIAVARAIETFGHTSPEAITTLRDVPLQHASITAPQVPFGVKQWYWLPHQIEAWCLSILRTPYTSTRWEAVKTLGQLEEISEQAESALLATLSDEDAHVRSQAVTSLNVFEMSSEVLSAFINVLSNDSNASVRAHVVECLGEIDQPSEDIVQALLKTLRDTEDHVRVCAVKSLEHIVPTSPEVLTTLLFVLLNDDFFGSRWEVVKGFIHQKALPARAVPIVIHALSEDKHAAVREDCAYLLGQDGSGDKPIIQALLKGLSDTDRPVRKACSQALVQLGQRFPEWRETITVQLVLLIQEQRNDTIGYCAPCDVAYDALWLLVNDGLFEPWHL